MIFPDQFSHPDNLIIENSGHILYYNLPTGIFAFPVDYSTLIVQLLIPNDKMFYGLGFDKNEQIIYASDPLDAQNGYVYRFNASDGTPAGSFQAGIIPGGFCFGD
ncbi:MAG: hypothetical protein HGA23_12110 [Bacteroidales bacterium]|nr:hypothetical protein [Bacteroidales bacterium]